MLILKRPNRHGDKCPGEQRGKFMGDGGSGGANYGGHQLGNHQIATCYNCEEILLSEEILKLKKNIFFFKRRRKSYMCGPKSYVREKFRWGKLNGQSREKPLNKSSGDLKANTQLRSKR